MIEPPVMQLAPLVLLLVLNSCSKGLCQTDGDVRLVDGSDISGRVEVYYNGTWGTVCDDQWGTEDATVVCRQLGLPISNVEALQEGAFGAGTGDILLDEVTCNGTEDRLDACTHNGWRNSDCAHKEDAGVICHYEPGKVRLVDGISSNEGRVEIYYQGWGTVCDDSWDTDDAMVVCRQLGFSSVDAEAFGNAFFGAGTGELLLDEVNCLGTETRLDNCTHAGFGISDCAHKEDAGVICNYVPTTEEPRPTTEQLTTEESTTEQLPTEESTTEQLTTEESTTEETTTPVTDNSTLFLPYNEPGSYYTWNLRYNRDWYAWYYLSEYVSWYLWPPSGFPFGRDSFSYIYFTADGLIVLREYYSWWRSVYPYPLGSDLNSNDTETVIAPFWTKTDFDKGGNVYYNYYYSFWCQFWWWSRYSNCEDIFSEINSRIQTAKDGIYGDFEATWALVVTWEDMPEVTSSDNGTENTNTYQVVLATDGLRSFLLLIYKDDAMKWQALEQKNVVIGFNNILDATSEPKNLHKEMKDKYRPDKEIGNMGRKGYWLYRLDDNDPQDVNPAKFCEEWANDQPSWSANFSDWIQPCPCTVDQAQADSRYIACERISLNLDSFNQPAADEVDCYQQRWPTWIPSVGLYWGWWWDWWQFYPSTYYVTGSRCTYDSDGALITGYEDVWQNSNAQLYHGAFGGAYYWSPYATKRDWLEKDVLARYYCCKKSDKCDMYETHRPPLTCDRYTQIRPGCFYGDPHIITLDGGNYSFNGLGEYTLVRVDEMDYELQGRTGFAMVNGSIQESGGTVFIAFAAKLGKTTVEFILNDERTEFVTIVNGTDTINATMLEEGDSYLDDADSSVTIDYTAPTNGSNGRIAARWSTTLPADNLTSVEFTVSAAVKLAMLDIIVVVPTEIRELEITRGLMGVYSGSDMDDFVFPDGTMLEPDGMTTDRDIFEYGESWRTTPETSSFSYSQVGVGWNTYNDESYVPKFLDELLEQYAGTEFLEEVYGVCGTDKQDCLFDSLATNSTEIGANTAATDEMFQEMITSLNNFPPNVSAITETSSTDSLQDNPVLYLVVGTNYTYQIDASDPNGDDIMYSLPYDGLGATISDTGELSLTPTSTEEVKLKVLLSDGKANTSISFKLKLCSCENGGECDWNSTSDNAAFSRVSCICTPGWLGDDCSEEVDSCKANPCYPGVRCIDLAPPKVKPTCGSCPPGLMGDGFKCFDFNECADTNTNDCDQLCTNNLGSYECSCYEGYLLYIDNKDCIDIDECLEEEAQPCQDDDNAICMNTEGSYECLCNDGYEKVTDICVDIDECTAKQLCGDIAECVNSPGSYVCQCPSGYYGDGITCTDIDECLGTDDCHEMAECSNLDGSYECSCNAGWEGDGTECYDINECSSGTAECDSRAECTNTEGSYRCTCQDWFIGDGRTCTDINECGTQINDCDQICINSEPGYSCDCSDGFELNADGLACEVAVGQECVDATKTCEPYGQCVRNAAGTADVCVCDRGALRSDDGTACNDIDECAATDSNDCDAAYGTCINMEPGYRCSCNSGYDLDIDMRTCRDIDECNSVNDCDTEAFCTNIDGSYTCTCNTGYTEDGTICTNIDECSENPCAENAECTDTPGSYQCVCNTGYQGDGYNTCVDINECTSIVGICDVQATCSNTQGSYMCECNQGYYGNGTTCKDINECISFNNPHDCPTISKCINNAGSYRCMCNTGYQQSIVVNGQFTCLDVNECEEQFDNCHENAECTNTDGGFTCQCSNGFEGDGVTCTGFTCQCSSGFEGDGVTCTDINECTTSIPCSTSNYEKCENRVGEYRCDCQTNYFRQGTTCQASSTHSLVVLFNLVKGFNPVWLFDTVNTEANRDALTQDLTQLFEVSSISADFLGASVEMMTNTPDGAEVTVRLDFTVSGGIRNVDIQKAFFAGLSDDMFLGSDSQVVSADVGLPAMNPCDEGTHDCYIKNFQRCEFVSDGQFRCEDCKAGYSIEDSVCTEILPCDEDAGICTDNNFVDCVPDGPGEYHCEKCADGFSYNEEKGLCVVYKYLQGEFITTYIEGVPAVYLDSLSDPNSAEFEELALLVCLEIEKSLSDNTIELYECEILEFRSGSINVVYAITVDETATDDEILTAVRTYMTSSRSVFGVDGSSFKLTDICSGVTCMNGGWCVVDDNFGGLCMCPDGITGETCDILPPQKASDGLSAGAVVGIVIAIIVCIILIIVIIVLVMKRQDGEKYNVDEEDKEPGLELVTSGKGEGKASVGEVNEAVDKDEKMKQADKGGNGNVENQYVNVGNPGKVNEAVEEDEKLKQADKEGNGGVENQYANIGNTGKVNDNKDDGDGEKDEKKTGLNDEEVEGDDKGGEKERKDDGGNEGNEDKNEGGSDGRKDEGGKNGEKEGGNDDEKDDGVKSDGNNGDQNIGENGGKDA